MAELLEKRRSAFLVLRMQGVRPRPSSCLRQYRAVEVIMAYLLKKEEVCSSYSKEKGKYDHGRLPPFLSEEL